MKFFRRQAALFRTSLLPKSAAQKVLFFHTSYGFPWWVYYLQVHAYRLYGYEVVVYDYANQVLDNEDPGILLQVVEDVVADMTQRVAAYSKRGISTFHAIGNSLGSYFVYNYALRYEIPAIVLNSGGSVADIIFYRNPISYQKQGYDKPAIEKLWAPYDDPKLGQHIKARKVLITLSRNDKTIPPHSSQELVEAISASSAQVVVKYDRLPHVLSVVWNSWKIRRVVKFLNSK